MSSAPHRPALARARPRARSGDHARGQSARARAMWDAFRRNRSTEDGSTSRDARENDDDGAGRAKGGALTATKRTIKAEDSINALSALLGDDERERAEREKELEADARRATELSRDKADRELRETRKKAFTRANKATDRIQRLQAVFLDVPLGMLDFQTLRDKTPGGEDLGAEPNWFKLPVEMFDKVTGERFVLEEEDEDVSVSLAPKNADGSEGKADEIVRLPGEFQVPCIPYPFVATPGSYVRLNLFEPRWLTLFSKLIPPTPGDEAATAASTSAMQAVKTDEEEFRQATGRRVLRGLNGKQKIDLNTLRIIDAYETGERTFDIVPGFGRLPEDEFMNTNAFGAVFRGLDGQIAGVGTMMNVQSHDVVVDGRLLSVCAKGEKRFKILRVAQTEPYIIVDAVPIEDAAPTSESGDLASVDAVNEVFDLMKKVDPYYMEAIGLDNVSKRDLKDMNEFDLANVMLYSHPTLALRLLACDDVEKRRRVILASAKSFKKAIELGFTPRKSRLLTTIVNFGLLFTLGFVILSIKSALDGDASGLDNINF